MKSEQVAHFAIQIPVSVKLGSRVDLEITQRMNRAFSEKLRDQIRNLFLKLSVWEPRGLNSLSKLE